MREKKVKATYMIFEYSNGFPMEVMLPDGRMAVLIENWDSNPVKGVIIDEAAYSLKAGIEDEIIMTMEPGDTIESVREYLLNSGIDFDEVKKTKIAIRTTLSFS